MMLHVQLYMCKNFKIGLLLTMLWAKNARMVNFYSECFYAQQLAHERYIYAQQLLAGARHKDSASKLLRHKRFISEPTTNGIIRSCNWLTVQ